MRFAALLTIALSLAATNAEADMVATQIVEKEIVTIDKTGKEKIVRKTADRVKPGETVIYTLKFKNDAAAPAEGVVLVMPVPKDVTFVEGSIAGAPSTVTFSADGGDTYVARGRLTVTQNGEQRAATNGDITHVKWKLAGAIAPKDAGEVSFRGVLK
jgi:uncharacterized repeat protein (TIGR01451 family)